MNAIIQIDGIVKPESLSNTLVYGGKGQHALDLLERDLLVPGTEGDTAHFVTLPISTTEAAIVEILLSGVPQGDIVSLSGVMMKSPNGVPAAHYLFGKGAKPNPGKALKVVFANTSPDSPLVKALKRRAQSQSLKIIETRRTEHDEKMAYTQGLMHLWLVLAGRNADQDEHITTSLLAPWKTPVQTVIDMIHANPFAEDAITSFFDALKRCDYNLDIALQEVIRANLSDENVDDFGTPNSDRILDFIGQTRHTITTSREEIEQVRAALNTRGYDFLKKQIESIRPHQSN